MTTCTTCACGCAPLNRLSVLTDTVPGHVQCRGGGGGTGGFTGDVGSVANSQPQLIRLEGTTSLPRPTVAAAIDYGITEFSTVT